MLSVNGKKSENFVKEKLGRGKLNFLKEKLVWLLENNKTVIKRWGSRGGSIIFGQ